MKKTLITAHAGCENTQANSLAYIEKAIQIEADIIEVDVRHTHDLVPVLGHDDKITIDGTESVKISATNIKELNKRIVRLSEVLIQIKMPNVYLNLDIKTQEVINPTVRLISEFGLENKIIFSGCDRHKANDILTQAPNMKVLLNLQKNDFVKNSNEEWVIDEEIIQWYSESTCVGMNLNYKYINRDICNQAAQYAFPLYVWTVNHEEDMKALCDMEVKSITTDAVNVLKEVLINFT